MATVTEGVTAEDAALVRKKLSGYGGDNAIKRYTSKVVAAGTGEVLAMAIGSVYGDDLARACQWQFGPNRHRRLWIDYIFAEPEGKGHGTRVLKAIEKALAAHAAEVPRPNIYVMSTLDSSGFFDRHGYTGIDTPDDEASSFLFGAEVGWWFAKPIDPALRLPVEEVVYHIPGDHGGRDTRWIYPRLFKDPKPTEEEMIQFFESSWMESPDSPMTEAEADAWFVAMAARLVDQEEAERLADHWNLLPLLEAKRQQ
jgi:hypothetical protein